MAQLLHAAYPDFHGGALLAPPIPPTSGLYVGLDDPFALLGPLQAAARNDLRDYVTEAGVRTGQSLAIPVRNQGRYGACTGFCGTAVRASLAARFHLERGETPDVGDTPSARYAYLKTRQLDGNASIDQGASMESACRIYPTFGVAPARFDPWDESKAAVGDLAWLNHTPSPEAEAGALFFGASGYARLSGTGMSLVASIVQCIAEGYPVLPAYGVPQSFMTTGPTGRVPMPGASEPSQGGHTTAGYAVFVDSSFPGGGCLLLQNSWGPGWAQDGWAYLPFAYFTTRIPSGPGAGGYWCAEAWTVR
jgi:hypothetical protein